METQEQKQSVTTVNETNSTNYSENTELVKQREIKGTPFKMVELPDGKSILTLGQYRLTEPSDNEHELSTLESDLKNTNWQLMIAIIGAISNQTVMTYFAEIQAQAQKGENK